MNGQGRVDWHEEIMWDGTTASELDVDWFRSATVQCVGTGSLTWEATIDGVTWSPIQAARLSSGASAQTATAEAIYRMSAEGIRKIRAGSVTGFTKVIGRASA